jgi:hypothetical protein
MGEIGRVSEGPDVRGRRADSRKDGVGGDMLEHR